jgi:small subunit ribosomal protein S8
MMTDPIADFLTRLRNAALARHDRVSVPGSKLKVRIAEILKNEGFITAYAVAENGPRNDLEVTLKYDDEGNPVISGLRRISKPGLRIYVSKDRIPRVLNGLGISILTTSRGVMTDRDARKENVGGEVICSVW